MIRPLEGGEVSAERSARADRVAGCLLGGAVGDALGAPVEFATLERIRREYGAEGIRDLVVAYGRVGAITDDTQLTLFTAEGLLRARTRVEEQGGGEVGSGSVDVVLRAYRRWLSTQGDEVPPEWLGARGWLVELPELHARRSPGHTCLAALRRGGVEAGRGWIDDSRGSGGVMRAAPAGLLGAADPFELGCTVAALTHSHPTGYLSAGFLAQLVDGLTRGEPLDAAVAAARSRLVAEPEHGAVLKAVDGAVERAGSEAPSPESVERLGRGWIADEALAIALFAVLSNPKDFEAAVVLAANHSGDSDTTASIAGGIAGGLLGRGAIPGRWLDRVELRGAIEQLAEDLVVGYRPTAEWRRLYPPS